MAQNGGRTWSYANEAGDLRSSLFIVVLQPSRVDAIGRTRLDRSRATTISPIVACSRSLLTAVHKTPLAPDFARVSPVSSPYSAKMEQSSLCKPLLEPLFRARVIARGATIFFLSW